MSSPKPFIPSLRLVDDPPPPPPPLQVANFIQTLTSYSPYLTLAQGSQQDERQGGMSQTPPQATPLLSVGSQAPPAPPPRPPAVQKPSSHSWVALCGPPPWGLSCLLALQVGSRGAGVGAGLRGCWRE